MRWRAKSRVKGRSRLCQAMYFYKTRRLVCSGPALSCCSCCSEVFKSQCRSVVGRLAMKIKVAFSREARWLRGGRCRAVGKRLGRLDSVESRLAV